MRDAMRHEGAGLRTRGGWARICAWVAAFTLALCATWGADAPAANATSPAVMNNMNRPTVASASAATSAPATTAVLTSATTRFALTTSDAKTRIVLAPPTTADKIFSLTQLMGGPGEGTRLATLVTGGLTKLVGAEGPALVAYAWDGKAWTPAAKMAPDAPIPAWKPADAIGGEIVRAEALVTDLQSNAKEVRSESGKLLTELAKAEVAALPELAQEEEFAQPTGEIKQIEKPMEGAGVTGIAQPLTTSRTVPYRVQLWLAPAGGGMAAVEGREFTYRVQMAHAKAGRAGAFYYVAYADTNGDGLPDRLIARSPLAMSTKDGGWTGWSFTSSDHVVFVGNAWIDGATEIFFSEAGSSQNDAWTGISRDVDLSVFFCGLPNLRLSKQAFLTNIRFQVQP